MGEGDLKMQVNKNQEILIIFQCQLWQIFLSFTMHLLTDPHAVFITQSESMSQKTKKKKDEHKVWRTWLANWWRSVCYFQPSFGSLSLRVFGLLSLSLLLFPQCFGQYVLRPSSSTYRIQEPTWNFELCPLLNPQESPVQIPLTITGYKC